MKEFRVSLFNRPGQLARVSGALGQRGVNITTLAATGIGILALVTDQEEQTRTALKDLGLSFQERELLTVKLPDRPGELGNFAKKLADSEINIESIYLMDRVGDEVEVSFTVSDVPKARQVLGQ
jgi:hypothetical protein